MIFHCFRRLLISPLVAGLARNLIRTFPLSLRPPSRNLIRVIRRRSRVKPGMSFFSTTPTPPYRNEGLQPHPRPFPSFARLPVAFLLSRRGMETDGAASAELSLLKLCRVVTEEDEVNRSYSSLLHYGMLAPSIIGAARAEASLLELCRVVTIIAKCKGAAWLFFPPLSGELEGASTRGLTHPAYVLSPLRLRGLTPPPMLCRPYGANHNSTL